MVSNASQIHMGADENRLELCSNNLAVLEQQNSDGQTTSLITHLNHLNSVFDGNFEGASGIDLPLFDASLVQNTICSPAILQQDISNIERNLFPTVPDGKDSQIFETFIDVEDDILFNSDSISGSYLSALASPRPQKSPSASHHASRNKQFQGSESLQSLVIIPSRRGRKPRESNRRKIDWKSTRDYRRTRARERARPRLQALEESEARMERERFERMERKDLLAEMQRKESERKRMDDRQRWLEKRVRNRGAVEKNRKRNRVKSTLVELEKDVLRRENANMADLIKGFREENVIHRVHREMITFRRNRRRRIVNSIPRVPPPGTKPGLM